jgi:hypothetical protein
MSDNIKVRPIVKKENGEWKTTYKITVGDKELPHIADSEDVAFLIGLGYKYEGPNSKFATMACRMLKIDSLWAD